jgi:acetyl-CoA carboxylase beta subunit
MKLPKTAFMLSEGPDGEHWKEDKGVLSPVDCPQAKKNRLIFKCKHCGRISYAEDRNSHQEGCTHPVFMLKNDLGDFF